MEVIIHYPNLTESGDHNHEGEARANDVAVQMEILFPDLDIQVIPDLTKTVDA